MQCNKKTLAVKMTGVEKFISQNMYSVSFPRSKSDGFILLTFSCFNPVTTVIIYHHRIIYVAEGPKIKALSNLSIFGSHINLLTRFHSATT